MEVVDIENYLKSTASWGANELNMEIEPVPADMILSDWLVKPGGNPEESDSETQKSHESDSKDEEPHDSKDEEPRDSKDEEADLEFGVVVIEPAEKPFDEETGGELETVGDDLLQEPTVHEPAKFDVKNKFKDLDELFRTRRVRY